MANTSLDDASLLLVRQGFMVKSLHGCFNLLARKGSLIFLLKVLGDANSVPQSAAQEMQRIAASIRAVPLLLAEKAGMPLEDTVVYQRYGVLTLTLPGFESVLGHRRLYLQSGKSGITVSLRADQLKQRREAEGYSLADLSRVLHVSRQMVGQYEADQSSVSLQRAEKLYDLFGPEVFEPIGFEIPETPLRSCTSEIGQKYSALGFEAIETKQTLFDLLAKKEQEIIITRVGNAFDKDAQALSHLLAADNLLIFERKKPKAETPMIAKDEFLELETSKELLKLIKECE